MLMKLTIVLSQVLAAALNPFGGTDPVPTALPCEEVCEPVVPVEDCDGDYYLTEKKIKSLHNGNVRHYRLLDDGENYGYSIWMNRSSKKVKAKYFAHKTYSQSVYERYEEWKSGRDVVMACSGAFTTKDYSKTVGLTVDNGREVNRNIDNSMDGLVIVYATGGIVVSDIDDGNLFLGSLGKKIDPREDKMTLLRWAESEAATIFQTQLLIYKNQVRITRKGRTEDAHRRYLVLAYAPNGDLYHIVYHINHNEYLFDSARKVFNHLREDKDMDVVAMINLDTGMYNILNVFDEYGSRDRNIGGDVRIEKATNLIAYEYVD
jgi:hypothetical protein